MNVEMAFTRTENRKSLLEKIKSRIQASPDAIGRQPDWGLPSSYDVLLAPARKRKVAVSPVQGGWVATIESKEVIDFALLQSVSDTMKSDVVAVQISDVLGACGYTFYRAGVVQENYFSEEDRNPLSNVRDYLKKCGIPFDVLTFREAVQMRSSGWSIL